MLGAAGPLVTAVGEGRSAVLRVLGEARRGRRLDRSLDAVLRDLPDEERAWVHAASYGVTRLRGRLDHHLDRSLHAGLGSVSPLLLDVLRLGAYQLLYMGGVPDYAALSQSVEQAKEAVGRGAAGLVNGVLRSIQREGADPALFPDPARDPTGFLTTWGSHPRWLVERWLSRYGLEATLRLVELDNRTPRLSIRPVGVSAEEARKELSRKGMRATPVGRGTGCLWIGDGVDPAAVLAAVPSVVQDPAAALVVGYASAPVGAKIADLCAAPGGKALALASSASYVLACDRSAARLSLLGAAVERLGPSISPVYMAVALGEIPPVTGADLVLTDVPCSGTGTLRRHPDGRWRLAAEDPGRMAGIQRRILAGAAGAVRPGGLLVYSTCTLEPEENEEVVSNFLAETDEFRLEVPDEADRDLLDAFVDGQGYLRVLPQATGFDGAFAARMRRIR